MQSAPSAAWISAKGGRGYFVPDYKMMEVKSTLHPTQGDLSKAVQEHRQEIDKRVIGKIEKTLTFKRYGIPLPFLQLSDVSLGHDFTLEYIFELRNTKEDGTAK